MIIVVIRFRQQIIIITAAFLYPEPNPSFLFSIKCFFHSLPLKNKNHNTWTWRVWANYPNGHSKALIFSSISLLFFSVIKRRSAGKTPSDFYVCPRWWSKGLVKMIFMSGLKPQKKKKNLYDPADSQSFLLAFGCFKVEP